jgi:hypothetical protein
VGSALDDEYLRAEKWQRGRESARRAAAVAGRKAKAIFSLEAVFFLVDDDVFLRLR